MADEDVFEFVEEDAQPVIESIKPVIAESNIKHIQEKEEVFMFESPRSDVHVTENNKPNDDNIINLKVVNHDNNVDVLNTEKVNLDLETINNQALNIDDFISNKKNEIMNENIQNNPIVNDNLLDFTNRIDNNLVMDIVSNFDNNVDMNIENNQKIDEANNENLKFFEEVNQLGNFIEESFNYRSIIENHLPDNKVNSVINHNKDVNIIKEHNEGDMIVENKEHLDNHIECANIKLEDNCELDIEVSKDKEVLKLSPNKQIFENVFEFDRKFDLVILPNNDIPEKEVYNNQDELFEFTQENNVDNVLIENVKNSDILEDINNKSEDIVEKKSHDEVFNFIEEKINEDENKEGDEFEFTETNKKEELPEITKSKDTDQVFQHREDNQDNIKIEEGSSGDLFEFNKKHESGDKDDINYIQDGNNKIDEELEFVDEGSNTNRDDDREIVVDDNIRNELFDFIDDKEDDINKRIKEKNNKLNDDNFIDLTEQENKSKLNENEKSAADYFNNNLDNKKLNVSISSESSEEEIKIKNKEIPNEEHEEVFNFCDEEEKKDEYEGGDDIFEFVEEDENNNKIENVGKDDNEDIFEFVEEENTNVHQTKPKNDEVFEFVEELVEEAKTQEFMIQNNNSERINIMLSEFKTKMIKPIDNSFKLEGVKSYSNNFIGEFYFDACPSNLSVSKINENLKTFKIEDDMNIKPVSINELLTLSQTETNTKSEKLNNNFNSILKSIPSNTIHQLYLKLIDLKNIYTNKQFVNKPAEKKPKQEVNFPVFGQDENQFQQEEPNPEKVIEVDREIFGMLMDNQNIQPIKQIEVEKPIEEVQENYDENKIFEFLKSLKKPENDKPLIEDTRTQIQTNDENFSKIIDSLPNYKYLISKFVEYPDSLLNI